MSDTLRERVLMAFAMASGLGILPDEEGGPWDEDITNGMDAAIALVLEEAAKVCDEAEKRERQAAREPNDAEELAAFQRGAFMSRINAAAIRALKEKTNDRQ